MAHFMARIKGQRGEASRLGHSSIWAHVASWQGAVSVTLTRRGEVDWAEVRLTPHHGSGVRRVLYDGPVSGEKRDDVAA